MIGNLKLKFEIEWFLSPPFWAQYRFVKTLLSDTSEFLLILNLFFLKISTLFPVNGLVSWSEQDDITKKSNKKNLDVNETKKIKYIKKNLNDNKSTEQNDNKVYEKEVIETKDEELKNEDKTGWWS